MTLSTFSITEGSDSEGPVASTVKLRLSVPVSAPVLVARTVKVWSPSGRPE